MEEEQETPFPPLERRASRTEEKSAGSAGLSHEGISMLAELAREPTPKDAATLTTTSESESVDEGIRLVTTRIDRYVPDQHALKMLELEEETSFADLFDITLTDGTRKRKCLLSPVLNALVYAGHLCPRRIVHVTACCHWFDETIIGGDGLLLITGLHCTTSSAEIAPNSVAYAKDASPREKEDVPLISSRGYYVHISNDTCFYGKNWGKLADDSNKEEEREEEEGSRKGRKRKIAVSNEELELLVGLGMKAFLTGRWKDRRGEKRGHLYTISELIEEHENTGGGIRSAPGPILARVVQKSKVMHYAKPSDRTAKYPLRCHLAISDHTERVTVVLWTNMCAYLYPHVELGDLVLIGNYRIKPAYPHPHGPPWELTLNAGTSYLFRLDPPQWPRNMLRINHDILSTSELEDLEDGGSFDFIGRVIFCGRQERSRKVPEWSGEVSAHGLAGGMRHHRWLLLLDMESLALESFEHLRTKGLLVKLFTNSQDFAQFDSLQEGCVVLLTDLKRVVLVDENVQEGEEESDQPSASARSITLSRSTNYTQIYVFARPPMSGDVESRVHEAVSKPPLSLWHSSTRAQVAEMLRRNATVDVLYSKLTAQAKEYFSFYAVSSVFLRPWPLHFFQHTHPHVSVHALRNAKAVVASLNHSERASVLVQGRIIQIFPSFPQKNHGQLIKPEISRKRKLDNQASVSNEGSSSLQGRKGNSQQNERNLEHLGQFTLDRFPSSLLPPYFDGLLPMVALSIRVEGLNRNVTLDNVVLLVPIDMNFFSSLSNHQDNGDTGAERKKRPRQERVDREQDNQEKELREDLRSVHELNDEEKEQVAIVSLIRYLSLQSLFTPTELEELGQIRIAHQHSAEHTPQLLTQAEDSESGTQPREQNAKARAGWPVREIQQWLAKVLAQKRLAFLLELYSGFGPCVEKIVTSLFLAEPRHPTRI